MKLFYSILLILAVNSVARADQVLTIQAGAPAMKIPFCGGKTRLACDDSDDALSAGKCYIELIGNRCMSIALYTASTFYPSAWTVIDTNSSDMNRKIYIDPNHLSGQERPYFYVFLHNSDNSSYAKVKYQFEEKSDVAPDKTK